MNPQNRLIILIIIHLLYELLLTLISSIGSIYCLLSLLINVSLIVKENNHGDIICSHYISSLIYCLFHFIVFTLSYAEILPWEIFIVIFLFVLILYYIRRLSFLTKKSFFNW
jgi:hypothetical protein